VDNAVDHHDQPIEKDSDEYGLAVKTRSVRQRGMYVIRHTEMNVRADCIGDTVLPVSADCNPFLDASWFHTTSEVSGTVSPAQTGISYRKRKPFLINHRSGMTSQSIHHPRHAKRISDKTSY